MSDFFKFAKDCNIVLSKNNKIEMTPVKELGFTGILFSVHSIDKGLTVQAKINIQDCGKFMANGGLIKMMSEIDRQGNIIIAPTGINKNGNLTKKGKFTL